VAAVPVVTDVPVASELTGDKREVDLKVVSLIWDSIRQSRDPADFQDFLVSYPESPFAPYAQRALDRVLAAGKIADTKDTVEIASAVEAPVPPKVVGRPILRWRRKSRRRLNRKWWLSAV